MRALAKRLNFLIQNREDEFLALGASLMTFDAQSREISSSATELAGLCAGQDVTESTSALSAELDGLKEVCGASSANENIEALGRTMRLVTSLDKEVSEFGRIIRSLQMLGISTRIESARLGDQGLGFSTLADDVETLAGKIVHDSTAIGGKSRDLAKLMATATQRTTTLSLEQAQCSTHITVEINEAIETLMALMGKAREVSEGIALRSAAVSASVSDVVSSLQFHDIVRQQVEHVEEALLDMGAQIDEAGCQGMQEEESPPCYRELVGWMADVSELQVSQLDNATERFVSAVNGLRDGLAEIASQTDELRMDVESIATAEKGAGETVFARVAKSTGQVVSVMEQFSGKATEIASLIGQVAGTVSSMSEFVSDIEEVGSEIELIAINASIKAAHTGEEGKALGVLAQAIQRLSVEAREKTGAVAKVLMEVGEASCDLEAKSKDTSKAEILTQYSVRQRQLTEVLSRLDADMALRMKGISLGSRELGRAVSDLARSIDLDEHICPGLTSAADELREIVACSREAVPVADDAGRPERLKLLLSRYTMEVERLVHESAFGGDSAGDSTMRHEDEGAVELFGDDDPSSGGQGEDDWDNVELF